MTAAVGILLATPVAGQVCDAGAFIGGAGNQTAPSISTRSLAYLDDASGSAQVYVEDLFSGMITAATSGPGTYGAPDAYRDFVAYRVPNLVKVFQNTDPPTWREPIDAPGTGRIALTETFVAWEQQEAPDAGDVGWNTFTTPDVRTVLNRLGRQHSVAAWGSWLAFIEDLGGVGTVHLYKPSDGTERVVYSGSPLDVSIWGANDDVVTVAITVPGAIGVDVLIVDSNFDVSAPQRPPLASLTSVPGEKVNPRLSDQWVGFEIVVRDLSTGAVASSQVTLWKWSGPLDPPRFYLPADGVVSRQVLHDLIASADLLTVVWADDKCGDFDIYRLVTIPAVDPPPPGLARCDDPAATVLAEFTVVRPTGRVHKHHHDDGDDDGDHDDDGDDDGDHDDGDDDGDDDDGDHDGDDGDHDDGDHDDGHHRFDRLTAGGALFAADVPTPVLVCIDAIGVTGAWVAAGSQVVAFPADFDGGTASLEGRLLIAAGDGRVGAVVAGDPGASLRVRVLADPGGDGNGSTDGSTCLARGDCPPLPRKLERASTFGCGTAGDAGPLGLLLLAGLAALGRAGRRSRR